MQRLPVDSFFSLTRQELVRGRNHPDVSPLAHRVDQNTKLSVADICWVGSFLFNS